MLVFLLLLHCHYLFISCHTIVAGYYTITLVICMAVHPPICLSIVRISFLDDYFSKYQWIFTKYQCGTWYIVEIWFGIANWQSSSIFDRSVFSFPYDNLSKYRWIFPQLGMGIDINKIWFGIADGQISSVFDRVISLWHDRGDSCFYSFIFYFSLSSYLLAFLSFSPFL